MLWGQHSKTGMTEVPSWSTEAQPAPPACMHGHGHGLRSPARGPGAAAPPPAPPLAPAPGRGKGSGGGPRSSSGYWFWNWVKQKKSPVGLRSTCTCTCTCCCFLAGYASVHCCGDEGSCFSLVETSCQKYSQKWHLTGSAQPMKRLREVLVATGLRK